MSGDLSAVRSFVKNDFELVGELGKANDGIEAYLARERATGQLVAIRVDSKIAPERPDAITITRVLGSAVPAASRSCPMCQTKINDWRRFCPLCGLDLSGSTIPGEQAAQLLEAAVKASEQQIDMIGEMPRAEGGAAVYFGSETTTGRIVAFNLRQAEAGQGASSRFSVNVMSVLEKTTPQQDAGTKVCPACGKEYEINTRFCPADGSVLRAKAQTESLVGEVVADRYHVLAKIGQGGMGQVYLAEHVRMGRRCAIKVLNRSLTHDVEAVNRFSREAANAARINDENVADIYDFGESKEHGIYLAMEYVEGEPLSRILAREAPMSPVRTLLIATQVARGLAAAHRCGVVHRDLTPNNIVIGETADEGERVKIVDFGIAKALQDSNSRVTKTGFVVGTPQYMSPEQLMGDPVDARSDIYQLGCIMFEMLTATRPFSDPDGNEQFTRRLSEPPPHARDRNPNISETLDAVVRCAMAQKRDERYESATALRAALEGLLWQASDAGEAPVAEARRVVTGPRRSDTPPRTPIVPASLTPANAAPAQAARDLPPSPIPEVLPQRQRGVSGRAMLLTGIAAVVIVIAGSVALLGSGRESDPPPDLRVETEAAKPIDEPTLPPIDANAAKSSGTADAAANALPKPETGRLQLRGQLPSGAVVRVNGRVRAVRNNALSLAPGDYEIAVSASGFETIRDSVKVEAGGEINLSVSMRPIVVQPVADPAPAESRAQVQPAPVIDPARALAEVDAALRAFVTTLAAGQEGELRAKYPSASSSQIAELMAIRGAGAVTVEIANLNMRRFDPAGTDYFLNLIFHGEGGLIRPLPFQARLAHQNGVWRVTQFGRRQ